MKIEFFPQSSRSSRERFERCKNDGVFSQFTSDYCRFGYDYFDKPDSIVGYGGYSYDGRYHAAAKAMCEHYGLKPGDSVLEIGCAKGFILVEFHKLGLKVRGIEASQYAVEHAHSKVISFVQLGDACSLPFDDKSFDLVFAKEVLPHIPEQRIGMAIKECMRVSKGRIFFEIQCGRTAKELDYMKRWDATHLTVHPPEWWDGLFESLGFEGDVHYKILIPEDLDE